MRRPTKGRVAGVALAVAAAGLVMIEPGVAHASGPATRYLVLAPDGQSTTRAVDRVVAAGGTVVANYHQIGVLVARSTDPAFADAVAGQGVQAAVATSGFGTVLAEDDLLGTVSSATVAATGDPTGEPLFDLQWDMPQIDVPAAHAVTIGDPSVVVGVLDSGISSTHPDLATQIAKDKSASCVGGVVDTREEAWNPTTSAHGTHVAGTIAAAINGVGIAGVAPGVRVASVKVVDDNGFIYPEAAVCGYMWAAEHGLPITNNSYFIDPWEFNCRNDPRQRPIWQAVQRALRYSSSQGVLHIASAGNENFDLAHKFIDPISPDDGSGPVEERLINGACVNLPTEAPGVVTVSSVGIVRLKSYFSSYGQGVVDVAAPGGDAFQPDPTVLTREHAILSTVVTAAGDGWGYLQGTSMASPHVAGVAALALSADPSLTPGRLAALLRQSTVALPCPPGIYDPRPGLPFQAECTGGGGRTSFYGKGLINALAAVT